MPTSLKGHTKDWRIGYAYGITDGNVGVFDPSVCSVVNDKRVTNEFQCGEGYKTSYVGQCTAPGNRFGCGDGPSSLQSQPTTLSNSNITKPIMTIPLLPGNVTAAGNSTGTK
jgi:hypothetical protein